MVLVLLTRMRMESMEKAASEPMAPMLERDVKGVTTTASTATDTHRQANSAGAVQTRMSSASQRLLGGVRLTDLR